MKFLYIDSPFGLEESKAVPFMEDPPLSQRLEDLQIPQLEFF